MTSTSSGLAPKDQAAIDYEAAKTMARSKDPVVRRRLAARGDIRPELLYYLASDAIPEVRREIAANAQTPRKADLLLATDVDPGVRTGLARKIARLAPGLPQERLDQIERMTLDILETLARDQTTEVRRILAEELQSVASAPAGVIALLARDVELSVCGPVLRNSPILSDEDLIAIIAAGTPNGALASIAARAGVGSGVADAIAASNDTNAIAVLLGNASAQIREETLDHIVDRAQPMESWHMPLVRRPQLSTRAAARLATFVADALLQVLHARTDLGLEASRQIADSVRVRLSNRQPATPSTPLGTTAPGPIIALSGGQASAASSPSTPFDPPWAAVTEPSEQAGAAPATKSQERPADRVKRLHAEGALDEAVITAALTEGDRFFVIAALALLVGAQISQVDRILASHSPRAVTALVWRAGMSMRLAHRVQLRLAHIAPKEALSARDGTDYPIPERDMIWQLDFFGIE